MPGKYLCFFRLIPARLAGCIMLLGILLLYTGNAVMAQNDTKSALADLGLLLLNNGVNIEKDMHPRELDSLINYYETRADHNRLTPLYYAKAQQRITRGIAPDFLLLKCIYSGLNSGFLVPGNQVDKLLAFFIYERHNSFDRENLAYTLLIQAFIHLKGLEYEESFTYCQEAIDILKEPTRLSDSITLIINNLLFSNLYFLERFYEAKEIVYNSLTIYTLKYGPRESYSIAAIHNNIGIIEKRLGNYDLAYQHYQRAIELKEKLNVENVSKIVSSKMNLASLYAAMGEYEQGLRLLHQCESLSKDMLDIETQILVLIIKARILIKFGDFEKAIQYISLALQVYNQNNVDNARILSKIYREYGSINSSEKKYDVALSWFLKEAEVSESIGSSVYKWTITNNLAHGYRLAGDFDKARFYFDKVLEYTISLFGDNSQSNISRYILHGDFLCESGDAEEGKAYLKKALSLSLSLEGINSDKTAWAYEFLAQHSKDEGLSRSIELFDRAIAILARKTELPEEGLPRVSQLNSYQTVELFRVVEKKVKAIEELYTLDPTQKHLITLQQHYGYLVDLIEKSKTVQMSEASKMEMMANFTDFYNKAITIALDLYEQTGSLAWAEEAFSIAERSKASLLYEQIRESEARQFAGIPDSLVNKESKLRQDIATFQKLIYEEKKNNKPDSLKLINWEKRVLQMQSQQDQLLLSFERYYPDYYQYKYENRIFSMQEIQMQLQPAEAMIEYYVSDDIIIAFCISQDGFKVHRIQSRKPLEDYIAHLPNQQSLMKLVSDPEQIYRDYISSAYSLYELLLKPFEDEIKGRKLIIIPDGQLGYISFESLLTRKTRSSRINYRDLHYVLRDHSLSYAYSASLLLKSLDRQPKNPRGELLAFAPAVFDPNRPLAVDMSQFTTRGTDLANLPQTLFEVASIGKILKGKILMQEEATESMFKSIAANYRILHIATHGLVDNEQPMYSKLAFFQDGDDTEDGFLNTYELFNMKLNAEMAVLSACNTGYGKHVRGEGLMTLARGFMYAGVPSLVISLWKVEDKATAAIMEQFYVYLKEGLTKDEALRMAKLDYIQHNSNLTASPYFWSSFISIGDNSPVSFRPPLLRGWMWFIPATLFVIVSLFIARRRFHLF